MLYCILLITCFIHVLSIKYKYLHTVNTIVASLFSLYVSQGRGHFETQLPGSVNIEGVGLGQGEWCDVCVCCESGCFMLMAGPGICILC